MIPSTDALFYSQHDTGDSPEDSMITHEVHHGPLATDLSSARTGTIRMPYEAFVSGVPATDLDGGWHRLKPGWLDLGTCHDAQ